MAATEFEIIQRHFNKPLCHGDNVKLGSGDDGAVLHIPPNKELITSIDTLVANTHFFQNENPQHIGYKALAVNLSDLAAMGATPLAALMSLTMPHNNDIWLDAFAKGFWELANEFHVDLIGGDLSHGPLSITLSVFGLVDKDKSLKRQGAQPNDLIYVSGTMGDAALALQQIKQQKTANTYLLNRLNRPAPRVALGQALLNIATAAIDISDGLAADLGLILKSSQVGAIIENSKVPLSENYKKHTNAMMLALTGGDDYELCFTAPAKKQSELTEIAKTLALPLTCIGKITSETQFIIYDQNQIPIQLSKMGYQHFY